MSENMTEGASSGPPAIPAAQPGTPPVSGESPPATDGIETVGRLQLSEANSSALAPKGFKSQDDLAAAYLSLEKKIGEKGLTVPGPDASDEDRSAFFKAIGRPDNAADYDLSGFTPPDGFKFSEARQQAGVEALHKLGLTQEQVVGVLQIHAADVQSAVQESGFVVENGDEILAEFDQTYPPGSTKRATAMAEMRRGFSVLGLTESGDIDQLAGRFGSRKINEIAMKLGRLATEDGQLVSGGAAAASPESARAEIQAMESDPAKRKILTDPGHPEHKALVDRRSRLYGIAASKS